MKKNKLLYLIIIVFIIWNVFLTIKLFLIENKKYDDVSVIKNTVQGFSTDLSTVVEKCKSSIVQIETDDSLFSGFIYKKIDNKVYVVSTYHGLADSTNIFVYLVNNKKIEGVLIGYDVTTDLAVIEIETDLVVNEIICGDSNLLNEGEFILSIGTPISKDYNYSISQGIVSNKLRIIDNSIISNDVAYDYYSGLIQLNIDVLEGYSGSPVLNMAGEVVGIINMKNNIATFALPIKEVMYVADSIINESDINKFTLDIKGVFIEDLELYDKNNLNIKLDIISGFLVEDIKKGSFIETSGLNVGDIIYSINGITLHNYNDLLSVEYSNPVEFEFNIFRDNEEMQFSKNLN